MYSLELGVFMFKYFINYLSNAFNDYFTKRSDIHDYKTRHVNYLKLQKKKKKKKKKKNIFPTILFDCSHSLEFF